MYVGGARNRTALVDAYATLHVLEAVEIERTLVAMLLLRWAVQADYFAGRIATNDMTGITDESENEQGLDDARRALLEVLGEE
jgi:hypothetical protein